MNTRKQYNEAHNNMLNAWSVTEATEAYEEACVLRQQLCPGKCGMSDCDRCFLTREYNDICRELRRKPQTTVTFNLCGCDVTINNR